MITTVHKRLSATAHVPLSASVRLRHGIPARAGVVVVGRLLDDAPFVFEAVGGRQVDAFAGDVVAGVLGARRALRGVTGEVPQTVQAGDVLHVLNRGGVVGLATGGNTAPRIQVLGAVDDGSGDALTLGSGPITPAASLQAMPPIVAIAGSCMHAGKTAAACALVRALSKAGYAVGVAKLTGVAAAKDVYAMQDCGAVAKASFVEAGLASTCAGGDVVAAARGCFNALAAEGVDVIVAELGDGLLGDYGVDSLIAAPDIRAAFTAVVMSAADPVAAWGGVALLKEAGLETTVVTGPTTDNVAGCEAVTRATGVAAHNAHRDAAMLAHCVLKAFSAADAARSCGGSANSTKNQPSRRRKPLAMTALAAALLGGA